MRSRALSRRGFARTLGAAVGAALVTPSFLESLAAPPPAPGQRPGPGEGFIQLDSNENPYGPSPKALEAMTRSQGVASRYPDNLEERMREAVAKLHSVEPANVVLGCGSSEILRMADMAFLGPGKNVVVAEPTFEAVLAFARVTRAEPVKVPLTADFRHDLPRMAAACSERTGLVYVCNPNNPTATIVTRNELQAFLGQVPRSTTILMDEAYFHFVENPRYASAFEWLGKVPNLVVARTFSKVYGMAGMRLGYAVGTKENIRAMREHVLWNNANASVLEAGLASLADTAHVPQQRKLLNDTRRWLCAELERDARRYIPSEANFVMIDVGQDVTPLIEQFRQHHILVGRRFPSLGTWLRVSIGTRRETEAFLAALREVVPADAKVVPGRAA